MRKIVWDYIDGELLSLNAYMELSKLFTDGEGWVAHTNFPITLKDVDNISKLHGVEFSYYISKYRFSLGIGKLFTFEQVMNEVESFFKVNMRIKGVPEESQRSVRKELNELYPHKYWVLKLEKDYKKQNSFGSVSFNEVSTTLAKYIREKKNGEKVLTNIK